MPLKRLNKRKRPHTIRKYIILPCCLLAINIFEEVLFYKAQMVGNPYWRTALIIGVFFVIVSIGAFILAPFTEALLQHIYKTSKKEAGLIGETLFLLAVASAFYFLYYMVYIHGPESLLPPAWHNPVFTTRF